jgi:hypothetical protein
MTTEEILDSLKEWDEAIKVDAEALHSILWALSMDDGLRAGFIAKMRELRREYEREMAA